MQLLFCVAGCVKNDQIVAMNNTAPEVAEIIQNLEQGNEAVLEPFFCTNKLFPYVYVRNGSVVEYKSYNKAKTNYVSFKMSDHVAAYTNRYGVIFLNDQEILLSLSEITNLPEVRDRGVDAVAFCIYHASDENNIRSAYEKLASGGLESLSLWSAVNIGEYFWEDGAQEQSARIKALLKIPKAQEYIFSRILPENPEKRRIAMINFFAYTIFHFTEQPHYIINIPYAATINQ